MYGQNSSDGTTSGSRFYKVTLSTPGSARVRRSNQTRTVSYDRLSSEMQLIAKSGGKVVSVTPVGS